MHDDPSLEQTKKAEPSQKNRREVHRRYDIFYRGWCAFREGKPNVCYLSGDDARFWRDGYREAMEAAEEDRKAIEEIRGL